MLPIKFQVNWPFCSGIEAKKIFKMAAILNFRSEGLAIFDLQVTPILPTKFPVNWLFGSGEKDRKRF